MGSASIDDSRNLAVKGRKKSSDGYMHMQTRIKGELRVFFCFNYGRYLSMCTCWGGNVGRKGKVKNKGRKKDLKTCGIKLLGRRYRVQIWCVNSQSGCQAQCQCKAYRGEWGRHGCALCAWSLQQSGKISLGQAIWMPQLLAEGDVREQQSASVEVTELVEFLLYDLSFLGRWLWILLRWLRKWKELEKRGKHLK